MKESKPRVFKYIGIALAVLTILLLLFINSGLSRLAGWIHPQAGPWVFAGLIVIEAIALLVFWRGVFGRHQHLLALNRPNQKEREEFAEELSRRMRANSYIVAWLDENGASLNPDAPDYLERCLDILGERADAEIQQTAKRIFLATALSQNGRLDALIVFVSLCRMVWRVSAIYNQRPHPREVVSLYSAVITSAFLALSIEELDISTEITVGFGEAFNATAPASITSSIPFAGNALQTFTASTIDGAANCYLALRAGIITRNAYSYGAKPEGWPARAVVYKEAGGMLLGMSQELVGKVASALAGKFVGIARSAQDKTVQAGKDLASGIGKVGGSIGDGAGKIVDGIGAGAGKLADGTISVVQSTGQGIKQAGIYSGSAVSWAARKSARAVSYPFRIATRPFKRKRKAAAPPESTD